MGKAFTKKSSAAVALFGALMIFSVNATHAAGTSSAQFLKLGAGARAAAMGDAFTSVADDVTSAYWNPAGLAQLKSTEISLMQNNYLVNSQYQYAGAAMPCGDSALGVSIYRMDFGSIDRYTASDVQDGSFNAGSLAGALTLGTKMSENFYTGVTVKYIQETLESEKATSFAGDLGMIFKQGRFQYGAVVQNLGPSLKMVQESQPLPQTIRLGASTRFLNEKLLLSVDLSKPNDNDTALHGGVEYHLIDLLTLRGGYSVTPGNQTGLGGLTGVTGGIGVNVDHLSIDYGIVPFGDLGIAHRISLLYHFSHL